MAPTSSRTFPTCGGGCGVSFDEHDHLPLLLPCGHGHCRSCLSNMEDMDTQQCPTCRADWSHVVLADLPTVFDMMEAHHIQVNIQSQRRGSTTRSVEGRYEASSTAPGPDGRAVMPQPLAGTGGPGGMAVMPAPAARCGATAVAMETEQPGSVFGRQVMPAPLEGPVCNICMDPYNSRTEQPLLLPCGHCFCRYCLSAMKVAQGTKRTCPKCRKPWGHLELANLPVVKSLIHPVNANKSSSKLRLPAATSSAAGDDSFAQKPTREEVVRNAEALETAAAARVRETGRFSNMRISSGRTSHVGYEPSPPVKDPKVEIYVKDASRNKTVTVQLRLSDTVERLRALAGQRFGSSQACQQPMQYNGRTLEDNKTLQHYGITAFQTVCMVCRLVGGASV